MPTLHCTQPSRWGTKIRVCNLDVDIGPDDGIVEVSDEQAARLLANKSGKWVDPANMPARVAAPMSTPILVDHHGNELSPSEAAEVVAAAKPDPEEPAEPAEPAEPDWPEVTAETNRKVMLGVLEQLAKEGHAVTPTKNGKPDPKYAGVDKNGLVDLIAAAYGAMA